MRKEPYGVGSFVHVFKRGARKMHIVRDEDDRWRFLKLLRYLNDADAPRNWERDITPENIRDGFSRPDHWKKPRPYVSVLAYCLMDNHFHLLLQERTEGGIAKFMQRLGTSMSAYFNARYGESGTLFQGSYKARTVKTDRQLQYLAAYINVKNPFERYPGGLERAAQEFDAAFAWAQEYPFSSLRDYATTPRSSLLDVSAALKVLEHGAPFKRFARDVIYGKVDIDDADILIADSE